MWLPLQGAPSSWSGITLPLSKRGKGAVQRFTQLKSLSEEVGNVVWSPDGKHCLLCFKEYLSVYEHKLGSIILLLTSCSSEFKQLCGIPLAATSALWHKRSLFFTTPFDIRLGSYIESQELKLLVFPHREEVGMLILATLKGSKLKPEEFPKVDLSGGYTSFL